ncbi:MAG TPA: hypothetical protein G4O02_14285 [Caldilineae bacterium]|nr:hypothetical protein [Caldilineae bacterium]
MNGEEQRLGVIDALSAGFSAVAQHPWLILPPAILDLILWQGPRLSVRPLVERLLNLWQGMMMASTPEASSSMTRLVTDLLSGSDQDLNLLLLLSNRLVGQPSLAALLPGGGLGGVIEIRNALLAIVGFVVLTAIGLFIATLYLSLIVSQLREEGPDWAGFGRRLARRWLQLALYLIALAIVIVAVSVPFSIAITIAMWLGPTIGATLISIISIIMIWLGLWMFLSLFFVADAIVLDDVNVITAVWRSVNVVGRNFWATVGLWLLTELIMVGFSIIWQKLSQWPAGAVFSIIANAYLGTGLVAASLIFYRDRYQRWQSQRQKRLSAA